MSSEENKAIVRRLVEAFNRHNVALLDELIAPDYFDHRHQLRGLENYKQFLTTFFRGFPDYHESIEDMIAEGDRVWIREKVTGTQRRLSWNSSYWHEDRSYFCRYPPYRQ